MILKGLGAGFVSECSRRNAGGTERPIELDLPLKDVNLAIAGGFIGCERLFDVLARRSRCCGDRLFHTRFALLERMGACARFCWRRRSASSSLRFAIQSMQSRAKERSSLKEASSMNPDRSVF